MAQSEKHRFQVGDWVEWTVGMRHKRKTNCGLIIFEAPHASESVYIRGYHGYAALRPEDGHSELESFPVSIYGRTDRGRHGDSCKGKPYLVIVGNVIYNPWAASLRLAACPK